MYFSVLNSLRKRVAKCQSFHQTAPGLSSKRVEPSTLPELSNSANLVTGAAARTSVGLLLMPITVVKMRYEVIFSLFIVHQFTMAYRVIAITIKVFWMHSKRS